MTRVHTILSLSATLVLSIGSAYVVWSFTSSGIEQSISANARDDEGSVAIVDADQAIGELPCGKHRIVFSISNSSSGIAEFVGGSGECGLTCCFDFSDSGRIFIHSGSIVEIEGELNVRRPELFESTGRIYLNDRGRLREIRFRLSGVGIAPRGHLDAESPGP